MNKRSKDANTVELQNEIMEINGFFSSNKKNPGCVGVLDKCVLEDQICDSFELYPTRLSTRDVEKLTGLVPPISGR